MDHEMAMTDCCKVMPDGMVKMKDGTSMRMKEGQTMTMDGKMMEHTCRAERYRDRVHRR